MASQYATRIRALLAAALVCAASVVPTRPASAAPSMQQQVAGQGLGSRVILRLAGDPVAATERALGGRAATPDGAARLSQQAEALNALTAEAVALAQQAVPGIVAESSFTFLFHGVTLRLPAENPEAARRALRVMPGVEALYEEEEFRPSLYASVAQIGAPQVWSALGGRSQAGQGVRVAILDSGIDPQHPMMSSAGLAYPPGAPLGDARYTSEKVIAARIYVRPTDPPIAGEGTPIPGERGSAHGTHLAGIVAGAPVTATYLGGAVPLSGVAPGAWLMNYRVFYPSASGAEAAYTSELLAAVEDAVADGAQVLLAGWTSASGLLPAASPLAAALQAAMDRGCTVVAAAGNGGPQPGSTSALPGGDERVITVGSVSKPQVIVGDWVDVTAPQPVVAELVDGRFGRADFGPSIAAPLGPLPYALVSTVATDGSTSACTPLPSSALAGRVAVAQRGECAFADKAYYAQQAGAVALVVVNSTDELTGMACSGSHCAPGALRIPTVLVPKGYGERLMAWATLHPHDAALRLDPTGRTVATAADVVAASSARGPAYLRYTKPDLVAPGEAVLSAAAGEQGLGYASISGTSVAAAHVAGAAALLRQAYPSWGHDETKAALMGSASGGVRADVDGAMRAALPLEQGAGRLDASAAYGTGLLVSPPAVSVPALLPGRSAPVTLRLRDVRAGGGPLTYTVGLLSVGGLALGGAGSVVLTAGQEVTRTLQISVSSSTPAGDLQTWLTVSDGAHTARLPLWVHVEPPLRKGAVLVIDNDFSQFESYNNYTEYVDSALAAAGWSHEVWDADKHYGSPQTIPDLADLQEYRAIIWVTGDNRHPDGYYQLPTPLTRDDQALLAQYLDGGGRLLALGQNLAEASDVNPDSDPVYGRSAFLHHYLGARWLQGSLFGADDGTAWPPDGSASVVGVPGTFLSGVGLDLGVSGDGAGNQTSIDEIAPGGLADGQDRDQVYPVLAAVGAQPLGEGYAGVAKACEPSEAGVPLACPYRTLYYSLGLEGINDRADLTSRAGLLDRSLRWLLSDVTASLEPEYVGAPGEPTSVACAAMSTLGEIVHYEWAVGGSVVEGSGASLLLYLDEGTYPIRVTVTDSLGHRAVAASTVRILPGGGSTLTVTPFSATAGGQATFTARLRNQGVTSLAMAVRLPLPVGLEYASHDGAGWDGQALAWSGPVGAGQEHVVSLVGRVAAAAREGIVATADVTAGGESFRRSARLWIGTRMVLPLVVKRGTP